MPREAPIHIDGIGAAVSALRELDDSVPREIRTALRRVAAEEAIQARLFAIGTSPQAAHFANMIVPVATATSAGLTVRPKGMAAIFGSKKHTGWYAAAKYRQALAGNNPEWVGNAWDVGGPGGPIGINPAIRHDSDHITEQLADAIDGVLARLFPSALEEI